MAWCGRLVNLPARAYEPVSRPSAASGSGATTLRGTVLRSKLVKMLCLAVSLGLSTAAAAQALVIGAKEFTEQLLVAEMTAQMLQASGLRSHKGTGFATTGIRTLQEQGIIDVYWEYT